MRIALGIVSLSNEADCSATVSALGGADKAIKLIERVAKCFVDRRDPSLIEHSVATLVGQRIFGLALGYEDLNEDSWSRERRVIGKAEWMTPSLAEACSPTGHPRTRCAPINCASGSLHSPTC